MAPCCIYPFTKFKVSLSSVLFGKQQASLELPFSPSKMILAILEFDSVPVFVVFELNGSARCVFVCPSLFSLSLCLSLSFSFSVSLSLSRSHSLYVYVHRHMCVYMYIYIYVYSIVYTHGIWVVLGDGISGSRVSTGAANSHISYHSAQRKCSSLVGSGIDFRCVPADVRTARLPRFLGL